MLGNAGPQPPPDPDGGRGTGEHVTYSISKSSLKGVFFAKVILSPLPFWGAFYFYFLPTVLTYVTCVTYVMYPGLLK